MHLPRHIVVEENNLLKGGLPVVPQLVSISEDRASRFFNELLSEDIEYRDINRSCEDRTQYINLMLTKSGITSAKVWVIAPARYTLLSRELIEVDDPLGVSGQVTWGYHVAPIIQVSNNGKTDIWVIDRVFSPNSYLTINKWLEKLNSPRSLYFYTGVDDYLFNSLNGLRVIDKVTGENVVLPSNIPNIVTGDFQEYNFIDYGDEIASGMAENDLAVTLLYKYIPKASSPEERISLTLTIGTNDRLEALINNPIVPGVTKAVTSAAKKYYLERKEHWKTKLEILSKIAKSIDAVEHYTRAIVMNSEDVTAYIKRSSAFAKLAQYDQAINDLQSAIHIDKHNALAHYNMSCYYSLKGDIVNACYYLDMSIENGYDKYYEIKNDSDLNGIRGHECYKTIMSNK